MTTASLPHADDIQAWYHEAQTARGKGDLAGAQAAVERIIERDSRRPGALYLRGLVAHDSNQFEAARGWFERAIEVLPHPDFYIALCAAQIKLRAYADATQTARQGLALQPDSLQLRFYEASTLFVQGVFDEAAISYRELLERDPDHVQSRTNLGIVSKALGALDEAEHHLRHAIARAPGSLSTRAHLGTVLLAAGRYEEAWPLYEDRWVNFASADGRPAPDSRPEVPLPQWKGESPESVFGAAQSNARGARLLVIPEQGHGDSLQFVRYLPLALRTFTRVGLMCPPALRRLFEDSLSARWPGLVLLDDTCPVDDWDWYCPMMSLPLAFGTRLDTIPAAMSYLYADPARAAAWRARLDALPSRALPRVGVVWAGGHSGMMEDKMRSLTPTQIAPLLALPQIHWISLQKTDDPAKRADAASQAALTDWMDEVTDFADTAALIDNLDLVIAVDTSVAHLAAAMGKPVWLFNRFAGCWRWLRGREDSPWYPTVRLFNQQRRGDWDSVLAEVASALQQRFAAHADHTA
ncbi:tetratricopeptide repeat protein [Paraburkholderia sp. DHOC27]|uniref:tetratricopeptide repeat protein n=1 Tax=Paraburkholderia sp. DHOC27 TaxID=2303330 RepID=UPI000E3BD272|nr:tetratricopeptide repeat protein [Paraburkholderia sp. DHOC27]RFU48733.1 hypothetical protein D0B32_02530 [Paraburkholderia sp. DHOC27]